MSQKITPQQFVHKWEQAERQERAAAQEHFIDLCQLLDHGTPIGLDPKGSWFAFEYGATKLSGGQGWADVWKRDHFGWEYKSKDKDLNAAYMQLLQYRESLLNPPLLIVSDINQIVIHTNFTNSVKREYLIKLGDILDPEKRNLLWQAFNQPEALKDPKTSEIVTEEAAEDFATLAEILSKWGETPQETAHFLIRLLFCLFAEDIGILPKGLFTRLVAKPITQTSEFTEPLRALFRAMSKGEWFGEHRVKHIDGGLFDDDHVLDLPGDALDVLRGVSVLDWSSIEPSVLGTLFERSLDPAKRAQLGAHYTSRQDIETVIDPVLMSPLRDEWESLRQEIEAIAIESDDSDEATRARILEEVGEHLESLLESVGSLRILDPACGSGNFLYVALAELLDLQKEILTLAHTLGITDLHLSASPVQLHGIELNSYAHELAEATVWIGYIQWLHENGYGFPVEPILEKLDNILNMDAILGYGEDDKTFEPQWPETDIIIGNPPYLGDKKMRAELGDKYVDHLRDLYSERLSGQSDLICYWFEIARTAIDEGRAKRAGLLATQAIRGGANRDVLERIKKTGDIFWAESDRAWILDGATVHVSMIGFDDGSELTKILDGAVVAQINPDLSGTLDLTTAAKLEENSNIAFIGSQKGGAFDISEKEAAKMLSAKGNPNGRTNSDVVRPWINGSDITGRNRGKWIIDFGASMPKPTAAQYEAPFEHVKTNVYPKRRLVKRKNHRVYWWIHGEARPGMREALAGLTRYIATPRVSKHRIFVWVETEVLADSAVVVFASDSEYLFGVLHSRAHELWARGTGTQLREAESGFRYSQSMTFDTFPMPWPLGQEPQMDQRLQAIESAAVALCEKRDRWLNPKQGKPEELKERTLTNLYNQEPQWLLDAHSALDRAVYEGYGWIDSPADEEILEMLLELNKSRAADSEEKLGENAQ